MKVFARNILGLASADLTVSPIALVCGMNGSGKSSLCLSVAAALTGTVLPLLDHAGKPVIRKGDAARMVHDGSDEGYVTIEGGLGTAQISWPDCVAESAGAPPIASPYAAGLKRLATVDAPTRATDLVTLIKATPTKDHLTAAMNDAGITQIDPVWVKIETSGWDLAHGAAKTKGAKLKGQWEEVTGDNYGAKKAADWRPKGWTADIENADRDAFAIAVRDADDALQQAIGRNAVGAADRERLTALAARLPELEKTKKSASAALERAKQPLDAARIHLADTPAPDGHAGHQCPWCAQPVRIAKRDDGWHVDRFEGSASLDDFQRLYEARKAAEKDVSQAEVVYSVAHDALVSADRDLAEARKAAERVKDLPTGDGDKELSAARDACDLARSRLDAFDRVSRADQIASAIIANGKLVSILAPDGLRKKVLRDALAGFNTRLETLSGMAGWGRVSIDDDLAISYAGRPYAVSSASERYRADVTLQVAIASMDGSEMVVVDGADVMDSRGRNGLFKMLSQARIASLVTMTTSSQRVVPDLAAAKIGTSYWIENGVLQQLSAEKRAA